MDDYCIGFGMHRDRTFEWALFNDPTYMRWLVGSEYKTTLDFKEQEFIDEIYYKAQNLHVPGTCWHCDMPITRMFLIRAHSGGVGDVMFCCDEHAYKGPSSFRVMLPQMCPPEAFKKRDKLGVRVLVNALKGAYFGNPKCRMNQKRMEEFFDNPKNFTFDWTEPEPAPAPKGPVQLGLFDHQA